MEKTSGPESRLCYIESQPSSAKLGGRCRSLVVFFEMYNHSCEKCPLDCQDQRFKSPQHRKRERK